jgi:hypothetical protein
MQAEKPDMMLAVVIGSLHIADQTILRSFQNYLSTLERSGYIISTFLLQQLLLNINCSVNCP